MHLGCGLGVAVKHNVTYIMNFYSPNDGSKQQAKKTVLTTVYGAKELDDCDSLLTICRLA